MNPYSLKSHRSFLSQLADQEPYSIKGLRLQAATAGYSDPQITELTQALIWHRHFNDFPPDGDGIEVIGLEPIIAWSGWRWKALVSLPQEDDTGRLWPWTHGLMNLLQNMNWNWNYGNFTD